MLKLVREDENIAYVIRDEASLKESDIRRIFNNLFIGSNLSDLAETINIPFDKNDTVVYEMPFKFGRADIVIYHIDGTVSVIEVKDGSKGYNHVVSGIGQASLYASQINNINTVRRCLLWTSTGNSQQDLSIKKACELASTIAGLWGELKNVAKSEHIGLVASGNYNHIDELLLAIIYFFDMSVSDARYFTTREQFKHQRVMLEAILFSLCKGTDIYEQYLIEKETWLKN